MTIRAVIVDDTELDRFNLRILLKHCAGVECVAECPGPEAGIETINEQRPDLVFLDVQMPGLSGFEVLERLGYLPHVIFVTAFDRYAIQAFEVNAIDYLMKPIRLERLQVAIHRLAQRLEDEPLPVPTRILEVGEPIFLKTRTRQFFVPLGKVIAVMAAGDLSTVYLQDQPAVEVRRRLSEWGDVLPSSMFLQLDRSLLINRALVREVQRLSRTQGKLFLAGLPTPFPIGRNAMERLHS